jgi:hypothetical protein
MEKQEAAIFSLALGVTVAFKSSPKRRFTLSKTCMGILLWVESDLQKATSLPFVCGNVEGGGWCL